MMADGPIKFHWRKVKEIPLAEENWKSIKLYFDEADAENFLAGENCIYIFRLSPPYCIQYNKKVTPVVYIGSGAVKQRWSTHRNWLPDLGSTLPGMRYEIWITQHDQFRSIEADLIHRFRNWCGLLPLINRKAATPANLKYEEGQVEAIVEYDQRYCWSLSPVRNDLEEYYYKQAIEVGHG